MFTYIYIYKIFLARALAKLQIYARCNPNV